MTWKAFINEKMKCKKYETRWPETKPTYVGVAEEERTFPSLAIDESRHFYNYAEMQKFFGVPPQPYHFDRPQVFHTKQFQKNFDLFVLRNGYRADSPKITFRNPKIRIGTGRPEWGAEYGKQYFIITWEA